MVCCRVILETDPSVITQRIAIKMEEGGFTEQSVVQVSTSPSTLDPTHLINPSLTQVLQSARENLKWSLLK